MRKHAAARDDIQPRCDESVRQQKRSPETLSGSSSLNLLPDLDPGERAKLNKPVPEFDDCIFRLHLSRSRTAHTSRGKLSASCRLNRASCGRRWVECEYRLQRLSSKTRPLGVRHDRGQNCVMTESARARRCLRWSLAYDSSPAA